MENNIVNVYVYIRVSIEGQVKQGYTLAEQRAEIERYRSSKSYNLIEIFKDEGKVSALRKPTRTKWA